MDLDFIGCTAQKKNQLNKGNIFSVEDFVKRFPRKYLDYRFPKKVCDVSVGNDIAIVLTINDIYSFSDRLSTVKIIGVDEDKGKLEIIFFNQPYVLEQIFRGNSYIFCGEISENEYNGVKTLQIVNPKRFSNDIQRFTNILPVYKKINKVSEDYYSNCLAKAITVSDVSDFVEPEILNKYKLLSEYEAILNIHMPKSFEDIESAKRRILFDDLFYFNYILQKQENKLPSDSSYRFASFTVTKKLMENLPFELTDGQREVLRAMTDRSREGKRINAVVMGDVGCGKTLVAELCMSMAYDAGYQSQMLAPTVVLAAQHYKDIKEKMEPLGIRCALLTTETKARERKSVLKGLADGSIHIVVGTHSLLSDSVICSKLAMVVVDEEHRFGVAQREKLKDKATTGIHYISMSATPIPRTLAMSLYGQNTQMHTIKTLPRGRMPIKTVYKKGEDTAFPNIKSQLEKGHQAYIVCPFIEASTAEGTLDVKNIEDMYKKAKVYFEPTYKIGVINSNLKQDVINETMQKFENKEYDILISTTIIEVGVNIPNATVMYVVNAERFGLAQLHQLRGRVGRGNAQGYCLLESKMKTEQAKEKIKTMCQTNDGFVIAQKDLELRGCGDFIGTQQSGDNNKYIMLIMANKELNAMIQEDVSSILKDNKRMNWYEKHLVSQYVKEYDDKTKKTSTI